MLPPHTLHGSDKQVPRRWVQRRRSSSARRATIAAGYMEQPFLVERQAAEGHQAAGKDRCRARSGITRNGWNRSSAARRASSNFDYAGPLTEMVLVGNLAVRSGERVEWDAKNMKAKQPRRAEVRQARVPQGLGTVASSARGVSRTRDALALPLSRVHGRGSKKKESGEARGAILLHRFFYARSAVAKRC